MDSLKKYMKYKQKYIVLKGGAPNSVNLETMCAGDFDCSINDDELPLGPPPPLERSYQTDFSPYPQVGKMQQQNYELQLKIDCLNRNLTQCIKSYNKNKNETENENEIDKKNYDIFIAHKKAQLDKLKRDLKIQQQNLNNLKRKIDHTVRSGQLYSQ
jgi:hypothetical protein